MKAYDAFFNSDRPFFIGFLPLQPGSARQSFSSYLDGTEPLFQFRSERFSGTSSEKENTSISREDYLNLIRTTTRTIHSGIADKIVISRIKRVHRPDSLSLSEYLNALEKAYPGVLVYAFRDKDGELWVGATPELLLRKRGRIFQTISLAGTQSWSDQTELNEYQWGEKEIYEQKIVTDFIGDTLSKHGAGGIAISKPYTTRAGRVVHLKSDISFESDLNSDYWLKVLHPTPAVCGFPRDAARQFILENEPHDRSYYSGFLGIQQENNDEDFFVNLRCMRIHEDHIDVFVGGGIMAESDPDAEWAETDLKASTLLSVLQ